ncbi:MAG: DNA helicase-2/ATP-dependent DNA helicase PcrA [Sphingobacteriales bacterium]
MSNLDELNPPQRAAVEQIDGPMMIIAGAGSGKTRVLTYRIGHMIKKGIEPFNILSLTFTNKAAKEMRERIEATAGAEAKNVWMGTFHSVFARILRSEAAHLGYPSNFTIYDTTDAKSLLKTIIKEMGLDVKYYNPNFVYNRISLCKNNLITSRRYMADAEIIAEDRSSGRPKIGDIYLRYTQRCHKSGAMDFDDLLLNTFRLFQEQPDVLHKYQHRFKYIMVDEFQDTNHCQYLIVKRMAAVFQNLCVVGDDAQSIYAFRGATIENILNFQKDYPEMKVYKLEQNYRSTQNIVDAANSIIRHNDNQIPKDTFSEKEVGEKIKVLMSLSDNEEGYKVVESIKSRVYQENFRYESFAILYRTNAQSRSIEEGLRKQNIPYKIYGGLSFYQRKEIKDLIAYFRLTVNPNDEEALKRVINYPKRGIGQTSIDHALVTANENNMSLWEVISNPANFLDGNRAAAKMREFATLIKSFAIVSANGNAFDSASHIAKHSGLNLELYTDKSVEGVARYENIQELLNGVKEFSESLEKEDLSLGMFLQEVSLLTGSEQEIEDPNHVKLMTIHSSKGLEFDEVFIVGLEENLFPSQMSVSDRNDLEEERRLFYVAVTRARTYLTLSYARSRYRFGNLITCEPSRFINEIDRKFLDLPEIKTSYDEHDDWESVPVGRKPNYSGGSSGQSASSQPKARPKPSRPVASYNHKPTPGFAADNPNGIEVGTQVEHQKFGFGKVVDLEGPLPNSKATILFNEVGQKQILLRFAKLRIVK